MTTFTLAINAGGKSSRMGQDKAFVEVAGKPLTTRSLACTDVGSSGCEKSIVKSVGRAGSRDSILGVLPVTASAGVAPLPLVPA